MTEYLVFQLYGAFASWGGIAVGEERPSGLWPTRSALLGIMAAAVGVRRVDEKRQRDIADGYGVAVRVDRPGDLLRDYHTAQVPSAATLRRLTMRTRGDELAALAGRGRTEGAVLSYREYRMDAAWTAVVWARPSAPFPLAEVAEFISRPRLAVFLGRKSCPPGLPLAPRIVEAASVGAVLEKVVPLDVRKTLGSEGLMARYDGTVVMDGDGTPGWREIAAREPRDQPVSRRRWQFTPRREVELRREEGA